MCTKNIDCSLITILYHNRYFFLKVTDNNIPPPEEEQVPFMTEQVIQGPKKTSIDTDHKYSLDTICDIYNYNMGPKGKDERKKERED